MIIMSIVGARLDYRLLHGIVATQWAPTYTPHRIMIVDDKTAGDPMLKDSMRLGKPAGVACSIISEETALKNFKAHKYDGQRVFLVTEDPGFVKKLIDLGERIGELVLGLSRNLSEGRKISARYAIREEDEEILAEILDRGVPIYSQYTSADKREAFTKR